MATLRHHRGRVTPSPGGAAGKLRVEDQGMADDDPSRETGAPEQDPETIQRLFAFDEDISGVAIPGELPILPLRGVVIFPSAIVPLLISREASLTLVEASLQGD